jgi:DNA-binding PucR family transcriptional regulator
MTGPGAAGVSLRAATLEALAEVSGAIEAGAGLPAVARAAGRALNAGLAVIDSTSSVLAVACGSPGEERSVLGLAQGTESTELLVGGARVGELRFRARGAGPGREVTRTVATLLALELERARAPERASDAAVAAFLSELLDRSLTDRENIVARGRELGADLLEGGAVLLVRAHPHHPQEGDWRARVLAVAERGTRTVERETMTAAVPLTAGGDEELVIVLPGADADAARRASAAAVRELEEGLSGFTFTIARSRSVSDPVDLARAGAEALLAANVAEARGNGQLGFEETGSYRLLLSAVSEDPDELRSFHADTIAPVIAYDDEYETQLLRTLETYLEVDGSVASTAQRLFTHRHTIRYRLDRVRGLTGLDVSSSDGRERLSLGLKAMQVLGIARPGGPAMEPGLEGGRVRRDPDRT